MTSASKRMPYRLLAARNIQRPQLKFKDKIDNSSRPFVPKLKEKFNALKSLSGETHDFLCSTFLCLLCFCEAWFFVIIGLDLFNIKCKTLYRYA